VPTRHSSLFANNVTASGGNIAWWTSYKEPGKQQMAQIWTVPVGGGTPRKVTDVSLKDIAKKGHIRALEGLPAPPPTWAYDGTSGER